MKNQLDEKQMPAILDDHNDKALEGIPMGSQSVGEMANEYLSGYDVIPYAFAIFHYDSARQCVGRED